MRLVAGYWPLVSGTSRWFAVTGSWKKIEAEKVKDVPNIT
jgi:hypothetical protein